MKLGSVAIEDQLRLVGRACDLLIVATYQALRDDELSLVTFCVVCELKVVAQAEESRSSKMKRQGR